MRKTFGILIFLFLVFGVKKSVFACTCYAPYYSGQSSCSGFNTSSYTYSSCSCSCSSPNICCNKTAVGPTATPTTRPAATPTTCTKVNGYWGPWQTCQPDSGSCGAGWQYRDYYDSKCGGDDVGGSSSQQCTKNCPSGQTCNSSHQCVDTVSTPSSTCSGGYAWYSTASYTACFETSPTNCRASLSGAKGSCSFNGAGASCYCCGPGDESSGCTRGTWAKRGSDVGCEGSLSCDTANGYTSSCPSGKTCDSYTSSCQPCGNSEIKCYKPQQVYNPPDACSCTCDDNASHCGSYTSNTYYGSPNCDSGATCTSRLCTGTKSCDDGNACTTDSCSSDTCRHPTLAPVAGTCPTTCHATTVHVGSCPGTDCPANAPAYESCPTSCGYAGGYKSDGNCGTHYCSATASCCSPSCTGASNYCSGDTFSNGCGGTCTGTKSSSRGSDGVCGSSSGQSFCSAPSSGLCENGSPSSVSSSGGTFSWTCSGTSGTCGGSSGNSTSCSSTDLPTISAINGTCGSASGGAFVSAPSSNLCDTGLASSVTTSGNNYSWTCSGSDGQCPTITGTSTSCSACTPVRGTDATCGSSNGGMFSSTPSSGLCGNGSPSSVSLVGRTYGWTCYGAAGSCTGSSGNNVTCSAFLNRTPSFSNLEVRNTDGVNVPSDSVSGILANHICQTQFSSNRTAVLRVTATDPDGSSDISSIQLRMGGITYSPVAPISSGVAVFNVQYGVNSPGNTNLNQIDVSVSDIYGYGSGWQPTSHSFKFWDCKVPISGTVYDGSAGSLCSTGLGYTKTIPAGLTFGLAYRSGGNSKNMNITSPTYQDGGNRLDWGETYIPLFTDFPGGGMNEIKVVDVKTGTNICLGDFSLTLNNSLVNPYSDGPTLIADYSAVMDQLPWFQVSGGATISKTGVRDSVPITCGLGNSCKPAVTIDNIGIGTSNNGLVAGTFSSNSGCGNGCKYGTPNNWNTTVDLLQESYGYDYFYREFYVKSGQGTVLSGDATMTQVKAALAGIGNTGIVFVGNNLDVNENLTVPLNSFVMVVVKNNINIQETVDRIDGVLVAVNVNANGKSANQLIINGTIQANNSVNFTRGYSTDSTNNSSPSIQVNYRPDFLFKMPGQLIKTISGWKQGL